MEILWKRCTNTRMFGRDHIVTKVNYKIATMKVYAKYYYSHKLCWLIAFQEIINFIFGIRQLKANITVHRVGGQPPPIPNHLSTLGGSLIYRITLRPEQNGRHYETPFSQAFPKMKDDFLSSLKYPRGCNEHLAIIESCNWNKTGLLARLLLKFHRVLFI